MENFPDDEKADQANQTSSIDNKTKENDLQDTKPPAIDLSAANLAVGREEVGAEESSSTNSQEQTIICTLSNDSDEDYIVVATKDEPKSNTVDDEATTKFPPPPSSQPQQRTQPPIEATSIPSTGPSLPQPAARKPPPPTSQSSSFAQLAYRTFETYMNEARAEHLPHLQMLNHMNFCAGYAGEGLARLTAPTSSFIQQQQQQYMQHYVPGQRPIEPIALRRYIHSTPLRHAPSIVDSDDEDEPPPVGLEILNRSRSTPLSTSKNSAFGTILRTNSHTIHDGGSLHSSSNSNSNVGSAFSMPPYPMSKANSRSGERESTRPVIFNPIQTNEERMLDTTSRRTVLDNVEEMTSIEVTNVPNISGVETQAPKKMSATARAAKFLTDVRNLRLSGAVAGGGATAAAAGGNDSTDNKDKKGNKKKHRPRGGRENPAKPASVSSDESTSSVKSTGALAANEETISSKASPGNSSAEKGSLGAKVSKAKARGGTQDVKSKLKSSDHSSTTKNELGGSKAGQISSKKKPDTRKSARRPDALESPVNVPSPVYHRLEDSPGRNQVAGVYIQVNNNTENEDIRDSKPAAVSSPEPGQVMGRASTPHSQDSPETARYSSTTSSSGQTTQGTAISFASSGFSTHLSAISETDREVADYVSHNARNVQAGDSDTVTSAKADRIELALATDRNVRFGDYVELVDSPSPVNYPRDGASVQAERFFNMNNEKPEKRGLARLRTLPHFSKRSGSTAHSPTTVSSASVNTNSSSSTMSEPPKIVSYLDRKQVSDLTSLHNRGESNSSPRASLDDRELRDSSPSDQISAADAELVSDGTETLKGANKPRPLWPGKGLQFGRKIRSLPPRSPYKGLRGSDTPPPTSASPSFSGVSPPRQFIDHRPGFASSNDSSRTEVVTTTSGTAVDNRSHEVVRLSPSLEINSGRFPGQHYVMASSPRGLSPVGGQSLLGRSRSPRTYEETSIEILKSDSKEDSSHSSSPLPIIASDSKGYASS